MEIIAIDGKRFERNDAGLFIPTDSVEPIDELAWFHRFEEAINKTLLTDRRPGVLIPVRSQGLNEMEFPLEKDQRDFGVDGAAHRWKRLGRAATYWHHDESFEAGPPTYRSRSFVLLNDGPENCLRETWMRKDEEALGAIHANLDDIIANGLQRLKQVRSWEHFEEATCFLRRFDENTYAKLMHCIDEDALRFKWGEWAHMALYCNNSHYVHRGFYTPEGEDVDVGFLYRHIAA